VGRFAVHEVLTINEEVERMIVEHAHADDIRKAAVADGMVTLRQAGLLGAATGITSLEEVMRVIA
jgi:type IV pilus assembly protein PilB